MKNGMNDDQPLIELKKDRVRKFTQERTAKTASNRLKSLWPSRDAGVNNFKIMQKTKAEAGFLVFIPAEGIVGFLCGFRLDDDV